MDQTTNASQMAQWAATSYFTRLVSDHGGTRVQEVYSPGEGGYCHFSNDDRGQARGMYGMAGKIKVARGGSGGDRTG